MKTVRRIVPLFALVALCAAPATAGALEKLHFFRTPSGRIGCVYDSKSLRCDGPDSHPGARPKNCDVDYGGAFAMRPTGRASRLCHGDTAIDRKAPVLRYGHTLRRFGYTCRSRTSGLTCSNRSGHGWKLSLQDTHLF